eukprot:Phypoly_transcript_04579.p1 GENE.Phypoly_transcript_04579~~Phypoly_transcript_04579.p1  ORF type:complete len:674 (+),score=86.00 Phypoly_transcript_04579:71-2092(+)
MMITSLCFACFFILSYAQTEVINLSASSLGRTFDGVGGISGGGATSRFLIDYPEPQRSEILDFLFLPNFGASLQIFKVEIGGDSQSTEGTESSHMHTMDDENYFRGYEWWMMEEAKSRNPNIKIAALSWAVPGWIGTYYSQANIDYHLKWINGAKTYHNITVDYIGIWNERMYNATWIKLLRAQLNNASLEHVQIIAADDCCAPEGPWGIAAQMANDTDLFNAIAVVGGHLGSAPIDSTPVAQKLGKPLWSSEAHLRYGLDLDLVSACWARDINQAYVNGLMTGSTLWFVVDAMFPSLLRSGYGLLRAQWPWTGAYLPLPQMWATAHTTQFTAPGWTYLAHGSGVGLLANNWGSYVTFVSPDASGDFTIVIETAINSSTMCNVNVNMGEQTEDQEDKIFSKYFSPEPITLQFAIGNGLKSSGPLHVFVTTFNTSNNASSVYFSPLPDITPTSGAFQIEVLPFSIYTITTTTGQTKGSYPPSPSPADFPLPYKDPLNTPSAPSQYTKYFTDQTGVFEITENFQNQSVLRQMVPEPPIVWCSDSPHPLTFIGNMNYSDYTVSVGTLLEVPGMTGIGARVPGTGCGDATKGGYFLEIDAELKSWSFLAGHTVLLNGTMAFETNVWYNLELAVQGSTIAGYLDGQQLFSITNSAYSVGFAALVSGFIGAEFCCFSMA